MKTTTEIVELANTGVNLIVDASKISYTDLKSIINAVTNGAGHITLKNCDKKTIPELKSLCINFADRITFDLS